jgi:DNA-binding response OmpR family regulator
MFAASPLRLIALTGWGQESDLKQAREAGFDMHRTKPVNLAELMAVIAADVEDSAGQAVFQMNRQGR